MAAHIGRLVARGLGFPVFRFEAAFLGNIVQDFAVAATTYGLKNLRYIGDRIRVEAGVAEDSFRYRVCPITQKTRLPSVSKNRSLASTLNTSGAIASIGSSSYSIALTRPTHPTKLSPPSTCSVFPVSQ